MTIRSEPDTTDAKRTGTASTASAPRASDPYRRILVPIDGSAVSASGVEAAIALAKLSGGRIRLLHVVDDLAHATGFESAATWLDEVRPALQRQARATLDDARRRVLQAGVTADAELVDALADDLATIVAAHAQQWDADLIVMGSHRRRGADRLLAGSDAEPVVRTARVPVLLVRAPVEDRAGEGSRRPPACSATS
jgi:nucleotide-binding universal stress UspA family protein